MNIKIFPHAGLFLLCLWLIVEYSLLGKFSVFFTSDNMELIVPRMLSEQFFSEQNSLWDAASVGGSDRKSYLFPGQVDRLIFDIFPVWFAHSLRISSAIIVAVLSVYLLGRRTFGFGPGAAMFAAAAYSQTFHAIMVEGTMGYMPGVLLALSWLLDRKSDPKRWLLAFLVIYVVAHTAFFSRLIPTASALIVAWFVFADPRKGYKDWLIILASGLLIAVLRIDDFLALREIYPLSQLPLTRTLSNFDEALANALNIKRYFQDPLAAACLVPFIFALIVQRFDDFRAKGILVWIVFMAAFSPVVIAIQDALIPVFPFLRGADLERAAIIVSLAYVFAGGYGIQVLADQMKGQWPERPIRFSLRSALVAGAVSVLLFTSLKAKYAGLLNWMTHGSYVHVFESPVLKNLSAKVRSKPMPERVESFQMFPAYLQGYGFETIGAYQTAYWQRYFELWGTMVAPWVAGLDPTRGSGLSFAMARKNNREWPLFRGGRLMLYPDEFIPRVQLGELYNLNILSLLNVGYLVSRERLDDSSLEAVRSAQKPWSSLNRFEKAKINIRANFRGREHLYIYRNRNVFPRFFSVPRIKTFESGRQVLNAMAKATREDLRRAVYVETKQLPAGVSDDQSYGTLDIKLETYTNDEITLRVASEKSSILIVANSYAPFWKVEIDGIRSKVFPAYHALWGVRVPAKAKSIVFRYEPPYAQ